MTGFFLDLTAPRERVLIASDTLAYTVDGPRHAPLGFSTKTIAFPHLKGALVGSGIYDIHVRGAAALMLRPEVLTFDDVISALPDILRAETWKIADERGIADPDSLMLFAAGWVGFNEVERKFELVVFENYKADYAPQRGAKGLIGIPNVPPAYVPPGFTSIASPEVRAMAGLRAIGKFTADHGERFGMAPLGGEIVLTEIRLDGVSSRVVGRFDDFAETRDAVEDTWAEVAGGAYSGLGLVNSVKDQATAVADFEQLARAAPADRRDSGGVAGMSPQQRRAAEKRARKAARRAA